METQSEAREALKVISLMYHDVVEGGAHEQSGFGGADAALYKLEQGQFKQHLQAIAGAVRESPVKVFELQADARARRPWLLTFDDGGVSAYTCIAGMLEEFGWRGHFFVTANYVGSPSFLSDAQIKELHRRGHVIGSHSASHPERMSHCGPEEMLREWAESVARLSDIVGERVRVASVPGGFYSSSVAKAAARAGVEMLFTSEPTSAGRSVDGCAVLGRYTIQRRTTPETVAAIAAGRVAPRLKQMLLWNAKKVTKTLGGRYYLKARKSLLDQR
jgi:peptidoglycan/xylan/chitin deacetylase (PgdA/CDA1 family)